MPNCRFVSICPTGGSPASFSGPSITGNDRFDAGGLSYAVVEPLKKVSMTFDGELLIVDDPNALRDPKTLFANGTKVPGHVHWVHEGEGPVHGGEPVNDAVQTMYGRDFSRCHFNQHCRVRGEIKVGGETFTIDGRGWRDHSWGPRYWQAIYFYRLFVANFPNGDGFMLLKITDKNGVTRRVGLLLVGGRYEEILDMDLSTQWSEQKDPRRVEIGVRTSEPQGDYHRRDHHAGAAAQPAQSERRDAGIAHRRRLYALQLGRPGGLRHDRIYRAHRRRKALRISALNSAF